VSQIAVSKRLLKRKVNLDINERLQMTIWNKKYKIKKLKQVILKLLNYRQVRALASWPLSQTNLEQPEYKLSLNATSQ
jgi:hypothetical protein